MGWAKYDEDNREIMEERRRYCKTNCGYESTIQNLRRSTSFYTPNENRTTSKGGFYINYSTGRVTY